MSLRFPSRNQGAVYTHCWELMNSVGSHGSSSLPFVMKVMVCHFVSNSHEVMTALIVELPLIVVVEISLQLHQASFKESISQLGWRRCKNEWQSSVDSIFVCLLSWVCRKCLHNWTDTSWRTSIRCTIVLRSTGWSLDSLIVPCAIKAIVWSPSLQKRRGRSTGFFSCWHRLLVCALWTSSNSFASIMTSTAQGQKTEFSTPLMVACWNNSIRPVNICQMTDFAFWWWCFCEICFFCWDFRYLVWSLQLGKAKKQNWWTWWAAQSFTLKSCSWPFLLSSRNQVVGKPSSCCQK